MKITNTTGRDLILNPGGRVPAGGSAEVAEADLDAAMKSAVVAAWFDAGWLTRPATPAEAPKASKKARKGKGK